MSIRVVQKLLKQKIPSVEQERALKAARQEALESDEEEEESDDYDDED